jgi:hypothetical protein
VPAPCSAAIMSRNRLISLASGVLERIALPHLRNCRCAFSFGRGRGYGPSINKVLSINEVTKTALRAELSLRER